jgi:tRNA (guanine-N7-)-methyltransferase
MVKKPAIDQPTAAPADLLPRDPAIEPGQDGNLPDPGYLARMAERRESLRAEIAGLLPPQAHFIWEIGCGHGHFLTAYAQTHPETYCIGIDINLDRVRRATKKRDRAGLDRLHFVRAEAHLFLEVLPTAATVSAIYLLFPDPWPKKRHHKYRLLQAEFLHAVAQRAGQGTPLFFRTDHAPYFTEVELLLRDHPDWRSIGDQPWPFELATVFQQKAPSFQSLVAVRR